MSTDRQAIKRVAHDRMHLVSPDKNGRGEWFGRKHIDKIHQLPEN